VSTTLALINARNHSALLLFFAQIVGDYHKVTFFAIRRASCVCDVHSFGRNHNQWCAVCPEERRIYRLFVCAVR
jgi:hypothetical protein